MKKITKMRWSLLLISIIFMFLFQLEARLINYVYTFHSGIILIESILLGGGIFIVLHLGMREKSKKLIELHLNAAIALAFFLQIFLFFKFHFFFIDLLALSVLFGLIFLKITTFILLPANKFYSIEIFGSFIGIFVYIIAVTYFLEEKLIFFIGLLLLMYAISAKNNKKLHHILIVANIILFSLLSFFLINNDLVGLIDCNLASKSFKASCLDDFNGLKPVSSYSHLKGRSDLYITDDSYDNDYLIVRSSGYVVSASSHKEDLEKREFMFVEPRIPSLNYKDRSKVLAIGVGVGGYVQAFQKYIENPDIIALEIDKTITQIYEDEKFNSYLPDKYSFDLRFIDGRRFSELTKGEFDVIDVSVESVNSLLDKYTDERTSLLYTKEALKSYINHLSPDGYLILEQYYPKNIYGEAMVQKFLNTLISAQEKTKIEFKDNIIMYTWAFSRQSKSSQRFISLIYKENGFLEKDIEEFLKWYNAMRDFDTGYIKNPRDIQLIHMPKNKFLSKTYGPFFNNNIYNTINNNYNTKIITDDKPFRHLITALPFPLSNYLLFLVLLFIFLFLIKGNKERKIGIHNKNIFILSAVFGILTFGLQYLLYYKVAAFFHTSLIYFSVFLIIPLFFSSIGGYFSWIE